MVTTQGLHPPDLIDIGKGHAIHFISTVFLKKRGGAQNALTRTANIGQHDGDKVLFTYATGLLRNLSASGFIYDERISTKNSFVGSDCFGCGHGYVCCIDSGACPDAFVRQANDRSQIGRYGAADPV